MTNNKIAELSQRLAKLANNYKANRTAPLDEAKSADVQPAATGSEEKDALAWESHANANSTPDLAGFVPTPFPRHAPRLGGLGPSRDEHPLLVRQRRVAA
jgi:hypothetical protein